LYWHSFADFLAMGGYAPYVWGAFGVTVVVMVWELLALRQRRRQALEQARQWRLLEGESNDTAS
jgi:heme exporter protein D